MPTEEIPLILVKVVKAKTKDGRIIGAASIVAYRPFPCRSPYPIRHRLLNHDAVLSPYSASKWAVKGLTQGAAMELAEHGIRVNCYAPGVSFLTQMYCCR